MSEWLTASAYAGGFGVDLFFVLSAYLITELLQREFQARGSIDIKAFYLRRILRIWPLYFTFLVIAAVLPLVLPDQHFGIEYLAAFTFLTGNWICSVRGFPDSVAAPLWSVSLEEQFYLIWPVIMRYAGMRRIRIIALWMIGIAEMSRVVILVLEIPDPAAWCNTLSRLDPIALGILMASWLQCRKPVYSPVVSMALYVVTLCTYIVVSYELPASGSDAATLLIGYPAVALASALALYATLSLDVSRLPQWLASTGIYLGRISYGLYVTHFLAIRLIKALNLTLPASTMLSLATAILMAAACYQFLERPFLKIKQRHAYVTSRPL